jgi:hypothetical protein
MAVYSVPLAASAGPRMRRAHRAVHRRLWPVLTAAVALGVALALYLRAPPPA